MGNTGIGTKFMRHDGTEFQKLAGVFGLDVPGMTREIVDGTTYDALDGYRRKLSGLRDGGQVTFTLQFKYSEYAVLREDFDDDDPHQYQVILPDEAETTFTIMGLVTEIPLSVPMDDRITCDVTIEIDGKPEDSTT